ncbi:hypothetical protein H4219_002303 [Mycoemilia scoparia]|uniref:Acyl-CoA dehydrogenase n=1 Tax=Mycoemilia scoparia TaxID=417184 RepID=A0A9W8DUL2_9FUNG|nr:hypothetical protein H4219_002303 [Mycoemilia scoparia]
MSPEFTRLRKVLADFVEKEPEIIEKLKKRARSLGLWNLFLPKQYTKSGAQLTTYEYGMLSEIMGRSILGPVATNCAAPDTGNMEVLLHYGTEEQKNKWLYPLLDSKIRSAFAMTEPAVASSDATNINTHIRKVGNEWVINGEKWWISNAGHPDCKVFFVLGVTSPDHPDIHRRHSVVIVPAGTPGFTIGRPMTIYGYDDAPHGHCEVSFKDVRVPLENIILGEGRGFEVIQGRLGPGKLKHTK